MIIVSGIANIQKDFIHLPFDWNFYHVRLLLSIYGSLKNQFPPCLITKISLPLSPEIQVKFNLDIQL